MKALLPWAAGALFVAGAWAVIAAGGARGKAFEAGSAFGEAPDGAALAFRYLKERASAGRGHAPVVLAQRIAPGRLPADAVLLRLEPGRRPFATDPEAETGSDEKARSARSAPLLSSAEEAWVRDGGRLVLATREGYGPLAVHEARAAAPVRKAFPVWPGVVTLSPKAPLRGLAGGVADEAVVVFAAGSTRVLARLEMGRGEVVLLSAPELLENRGLAEADHLGLLEALAPADRPVAFDEWAHGLGQEQSLLRLLFAWGFGPALATAALAFALALWRSRARLGAPEQDAVEARSEAVDLVQSLSQLYDRALSRREAAALDLEGFRRAVALRTGLSGPALEKRARELVGTALPPLRSSGEIPAAELQLRLGSLNDAYRRLHEHAHTRRRP